MVVVDQHALHERILYEQIREKVLSESLGVAAVTVPEPVTLTPAEAGAAIEAKELLSKIGSKSNIRRRYGTHHCLPCYAANIGARKKCFDRH